MEELKKAGKEIVLEKIKLENIEEALLDSELRYNLALEGAGTGLWDWDMRANTVYFSPVYKRILGYENDEFENKFDSWRNAWHPEEEAKNQQAMADYLQGKTVSYELTHRLRHKNGNYRWVLARGFTVKDPSGKPFRFIGTIIDITALIEEREQHSTLQRFFDISPDLMLIMTMDGVIRNINHSWRDLLGYTEEEITSAPSQIWCIRRIGRLTLTN